MHVQKADGLRWHAPRPDRVAGNRDGDPEHVRTFADEAVGHESAVAEAGHGDTQRVDLHPPLDVADDASVRPLSAKLLERPALLDRIRAAIGNVAHAHLVPYVSTELEQAVGDALEAARSGGDTWLLSA